MSLPVISVAQMREWEKATWATGQTQGEVIRRVGECIAAAALRLTNSGDLIVVLAGKGNNGADARAAREHLLDRRVQVLDIKEPKEEQSKVAALLSLSPALLIDGLFGIGINRPLDTEWVALIGHLNKTGVQILALDVPSGLDADTGEARGAAV